MKQQKRKYRLVSRLYYLSLGMLVVFTVHLSIVAGFDIFQEKPYKNFTFMPSHVTGYTLTADLQVKTFDTIINYKREKTAARPMSEYGSVFIKDGESAGHTRTGIDSILNDPAYSKTVITQTRNVRAGSERNTNIGEVNIAPVQADAVITIKPKSIWLTIILAVRNYSAGLSILFVLVQLVRLFKTLRKDFSFHSSLSGTIYRIGICLLLYQLLLFATGTLASLFIDSLTYNEMIAGVYELKQTMILHISYDINPVTIFTGLSLIALSKLLTYGSELQQENELTV